MYKQVIKIKVNDNYGFLDEICNLFAINKLTRADFTAEELKRLTDIFVPLVKRNVNSNLKWNFYNNKNQYLADLKKYKTYPKTVSEWILN